MQSLVHSMATMYVNGSVPPLQMGLFPHSISTGSWGYQQSLSAIVNGFSGNGNNFGNQGNRSFCNNSYPSSGNNYGSPSGNNNFGGNCYIGKGNSGYKSKFNGNRSGNYWFGNTFTRQNVIPECQIYSRKRHTAVTCLYINDNSQNAKSMGNDGILPWTADIGVTMRTKELLILFLFFSMLIMHFRTILLNSNFLFLSPMFRYFFKFSTSSSSLSSTCDLRPVFS
ncbi:hypothetical protein DVH24_027828 [Malus domestica]|uniref:Uncharacterized protein n=1 Tax=Malus domestica TaxID=3750 RepID=A0A498HEY4_MALDO|nr:hypothetical protein DVH24_027828 [Malus domestica]